MMMNMRATNTARRVASMIGRVRRDHGVAHGTRGKKTKEPKPKLRLFDVEPDVPIGLV
jgi:hypothetical protein